MSQISCPCTETAYTTMDVHFKFILYWLWVPCATWLIRGAISRHTNDQNMVSLHRGCITLRLHHTWDMSHIQLRVKCKTWSCITLSHVSLIRLFHRSLLYVSFICFFYKSLIYIYILVSATYNSKSPSIWMNTLSCVRASQSCSSWTNTTSFACIHSWRGINEYNIVCLYSFMKS